MRVALASPSRSIGMISAVFHVVLQLGALQALPIRRAYVVYSCHLDIGSVRPRRLTCTSTSSANFERHGSDSSSTVNSVGVQACDPRSPKWVPSLHAEHSCSMGSGSHR